MEAVKSFPSYFVSNIKFNNPKIFIVSNFVELLKFHMLTIFWFTRSIFAWLFDKASGFQSFVVWNSIIYYTLMIYGLVFAGSMIINYGDMGYRYKDMNEHMDKWYYRWLVYFLTFMMVINTVSFIAAVVLMWQARDKHD
jgi:hypothetical protein